MIDDSVEAVLSAIEQLDRRSQWTVVEQVSLECPAFHPQGLTRTDRGLVLSSAEIVEPTAFHDQPVDGFDRSAGAGRGHVVELDDRGRPARRLSLGEGAIYHPGGIDFDGESVWVPVAEYRPDSRSIIYRLDPESFEATEAFRFPDHIGGIVRDRATGLLYAVTWGSRELLTLTVDGEVVHRAGNSSHLIDYQSCVTGGAGRMVCSGVTDYHNSAGDSFALGGIGIVDIQTGGVVYEIPVTMLSANGRVVTYNAVHLEVHDGRLRMLAVADDGELAHDSQLIVLEAAPAPSPQLGSLVRTARK